MSETVEMPEPALRLAKSDPEPVIPGDKLPVAELGPVANPAAPESIVEALLFATDTPLSVSKMAEIAEQSNREIKQHIATLNERYQRCNTAFRIEEIAQGYQMLTLVQFNPYVARLHRARQETKLSKAALETLAIIAYKQPVLRADVEAVRGVACGEVMNRLREMNLIKITGRAEDVGHPILYGTTKKFLDVFGLASLEDLPELEELSPPGTPPSTL